MKNFSQMGGGSALNLRKAFTMIELTLIIVILGIIAAIAIPRLVVNRDDAKVLESFETVKHIVEEWQTIKAVTPVKDQIGTIISAMQKYGNGHGGYKYSMSNIGWEIKLKIDEDNKPCITIPMPHWNVAMDGSDGAGSPSIEFGLNDSPLCMKLAKMIEKAYPTQKTIPSREYPKIITAE